MAMDEKEAIRKQIEVLTERSNQLLEKMKAGQELTPEEDQRLDIITSQIRHLMAYLRD